MKTHWKRTRYVCVYAIMHISNFDWYIVPDTAHLQFSVIFARPRILKINCSFINYIKMTHTSTVWKKTSFSLSNWVSTRSSWIKILITILSIHTSKVLYGFEKIFTIVVRPNDFMGDQARKKWTHLYASSLSSRLGLWNKPMETFFPFNHTFCLLLTKKIKHTTSS